MRARAHDEHVDDVSRYRHIHTHAHMHEYSDFLVNTISVGARFGSPQLQSCKYSTCIHIQWAQDPTPQKRDHFLMPCCNMAQSQNNDSLRCSICLETLKEPKVLPCCHTFCKGCLSKLPVMKKPQAELSVRGEQPSKNMKPLSSTSSDDVDLFGEEEIKETSTDVESPKPLSVASEDELEPHDQGTVAQVEITPKDSPTEIVEDLVDYLTCPQCRAEHKVVGPNGVDGFLTDYIADSQLKEQEASSISAARTLTCDGCESSEPVVAFCDTCFEYLCDFLF